MGVTMENLMFSLVESFGGKTSLILYYSGPRDSLNPPAVGVSVQCGKSLSYILLLRHTKFFLAKGIAKCSR